jgi:SAM-dependent methyltransferase
MEISQLPRPLICSVCSGSEFEPREILDGHLIRDWELDPRQVAYINKQQGTRCTTCWSNYRSIVLARAICSFSGFTGVLQDLRAHLTDNLQSRKGSANFSILELNEAGTLTKYLETLPGYALESYPEVDMMALPYASESFDLVIHSDTLEHVPDPLLGLRECRRVLKAGGACIFTVPSLVERLSRRREGMAPSFHGDYKVMAEDHLVHTEFGADAWTYAAQAGFEKIIVDVLDYPAAIALSALMQPMATTRFKSAQSSTSSSPWQKLFSLFQTRPNHK